MRRTLAVIAVAAATVTVGLLVGCAAETEPMARAPTARTPTADVQRFARACERECLRQLNSPSGQELPRDEDRMKAVCHDRCDADANQAWHGDGPVGSLQVGLVEGDSGTFDVAVRIVAVDAFREAAKEADDAAVTTIAEGPSRDCSRKMALQIRAENESGCADGRAQRMLEREALRAQVDALTAEYNDKTAWVKAHCQRTPNAWTARKMTRVTDGEGNAVEIEYPHDTSTVAFVDPPAFCPEGTPNDTAEFALGSLGHSPLRLKKRDLERKLDSLRKLCVTSDDQAANKVDPCGSHRGGENTSTVPKP